MNTVLLKFIYTQILISKIKSINESSKNNNIISEM